MTERRLLRAAFLADVGWNEAQVSDLAGDASNRKYFRLRLGSTRVVLMDAPPEQNESVEPFVRIARYLRDASLSAPEVLAQDCDKGFLLLEDLGDDLFARVLRSEPLMEEELYCAAIDTLIALHQRSVPQTLDAYDPALMADLSGLVFDWYLKGAVGEPDTESRTRFVSEFESRMEALDGLTEVLIQRDYHAENLLWLPQRNGVARVGLLDFQDAMKGHRAYDVVSLLQDARRDVSPWIEERMIDRYVTTTQIDGAKFRHAYALMGLQRNLRIIGVFSRLCLRDEKPHYIDLIPRVWTHMMRDLESSNLGDAKTVLTETLPCPDEATLENLRAKCGQFQPQL